MVGYKPLLLFAFATMLICKAWAGGKAVNGLSFQIFPEPKTPCLFHPFQLRQERDPFFTDLKQLKKKNTLEYRRGKQVVANFPDSTTVIVEYWGGPQEFSSCATLPVFDPERVKFQLTWKSDSQSIPANGTYVVSKEFAPGPWCEKNCADAWKYELRVDSQNIPLQDHLIVSIEAQNGTRLAEYIGTLSTERVNEPQQIPIRFPNAP